MDNQPNKRLQYTYWSSMSGTEDKPENYVTITYELQEESRKTTLFITQENIPDEKAKERSEEDWRTILNKLKQMSENKK